MAEATGGSDSTVARIRRVYGLKPHLSRTFKLSNDKQFAEKLEDVVGMISKTRGVRSAGGGKTNCGTAAVGVLCGVGSP